MGTPISAAVAGLVDTPIPTPQMAVATIARLIKGFFVGSLAFVTPCGACADTHDAASRHTASIFPMNFIWCYSIIPVGTYRARPLRWCVAVSYYHQASILSRFCQDQNL